MLGMPMAPPPGCTIGLSAGTPFLSQALWLPPPPSIPYPNALPPNITPSSSLGTLSTNRS